MLIERLLKVAMLGTSWVLYLLLALSVFSMAAMFERWLFFRKRADDVDELSERLIELLERGDREGGIALLKKNKSVEASVVEPAMKYLDGGPEALADAIDSNMIRTRWELERGSTLLGTLGNNAPFIGLFGTVIGVIIAFQQLGSSQSSASMAAVMTGIAEALIATGVGLFVAIPAVVAYNIVQKKIGDIENNVAALSKDLTALLKAEATRNAGGAGRSLTPSPPAAGVTGDRRDFAEAEAN